MSEFHINDDLFDEFASVEDEFSCYRLAARLGGLARWVLCDAALDAAAQFWERTGHAKEAEYLRNPPRLARKPGVCGVLFVQNPAHPFPAVRPAFALPVRWERAEAPADGTDIPPGLRTEAETVLRLLDDGGPARFAGKWRLRLAADDEAPDRYDLSGWNAVGGGSAWGILSAAVLTAQYGEYEIANDPTVWASVAWDAATREPLPVTGFGEKLIEARRLGATTVFAAGTQSDAVGVEVERLGGPGGTPDVWLRPLCLALAARPGAIAHYRGADDQFFKDASRYHQLLAGLKQAAGARAYYREQLLGPIAARCRAQLPAGWSSFPRLVTFQSESSELVELGAAIHHPVSVLVLHTPETAPKFEGERARLVASIRLAAERTDCEVHFVAVASNTLPGGLPEAVLAFGRVAPDDLVVDLTPGPKTVTLALYADLAIPGARFTYLHTERRPNAVAIRHGTESVIIVHPLNGT